MEVPTPPTQRHHSPTPKREYFIQEDVEMVSVFMENLLSLINKLNRVTLHWKHSEVLKADTTVNFLKAQNAYHDHSISDSANPHSSIRNQHGITMTEFADKLCLFHIDLSNTKILVKDDNQAIYNLRLGTEVQRYELQKHDKTPESLKNMVREDESKSGENIGIDHDDSTNNMLTSANVRRDIYSSIINTTKFQTENQEQAIDMSRSPDNTDFANKFIVFQEPSYENNKSDLLELVDIKEEVSSVHSDDSNVISENSGYEDIISRSVSYKITDDAINDANMTKDQIKDPDYKMESDTDEEREGEKSLSKSGKLKSKCGKVKSKSGKVKSKSGKLKSKSLKVKLKSTTVKPKTEKVESEIDEKPKKASSTPATVYPCTKCTCKFPLKYQLLKHIQIVHAHSADMSMMCHECGRVFTCKRNIYSHLLTHNRRYTCDLCGRSFPRKKVLVEHKRTHSNERNYLCNICGASFKVKACLFKHNQLKHSTERKHACKLCPKTFPMKNTLVRHIREVHDRSRPFVCERCPKAFANRTNLRVHEASHERGTL